MTDYTHTGRFDTIRFREAFNKRRTDHLYFRVRFTDRAVENAWVLVQQLAADARMTDLRWMAYVLATAFWEASHTVPEVIQTPKLGKGGRPVLDKQGKPVMIQRMVRVWEVMVPINEFAPSDTRRYKAPVKVRRIAAEDLPLLQAMSILFKAQPIEGGAWIVERDGDQFVVSSDGRTIWRSKGAEMGASVAGAAAETYAAFHGDEHVYFGRGYVQLTWWANYAAAGVAIGRGLDLLFNPALALEPQVAYDVMAHGLITGEGFANGRKLSDYIAGSKKDYVNARRMVNAGDIASYQPIAEIAELFEAMLLEARQ